MKREEQSPHGKSVKLHQTDKKTRPFVSFVCLSVFRWSVVFVRSVHPMGGQNAMLHKNLRGGEEKIQDQPINTRNLVS